MFAAAEGFLARKAEVNQRSMAAAATGFIPCFRTVSIRVLQVSREPKFAEALEMTTLLRRCGALAASDMQVILAMESGQKWKRSSFSASARARTSVAG